MRLPWGCRSSFLTIKINLATPPSDKASFYLLLPNKPIVGRGLPALETGTGVDFHTKFEKAGFKISIQPFMPEVVGQEPFKLVLGKNSGNATIEYFLDKLGIKATEDQIEEIMGRVKYEGRIQKSLISESQFANICKEVMR